MCKQDASLFIIVIIIYQQPGYRNGIWDWNMYHADNEKRERRNNGRNKTTESGNHQNTWRKKITITCEYWKQTPTKKNKDERKSKKRVP